MTNHKDTIGEKIPTVSRVAGDTLVELVYDRAKRKTGLIVSRFGGLWNLEAELALGSGELLVPYSATNNLIAKEYVLLPTSPVEYGFKNELIADICAYIHRYVDLSPRFERIAAYYVLLTWVHDAFEEVPYLRLKGDYGTGKTRALMVIGSLCYKSFFASGASTVSPIFHILDTFGGTLVLDEADLPFSDAKAELVKILNNGTVAGMPVLRTLQNRYKEFNPYAFKVFGPKIVATRERFDDHALESRFLTEETGLREVRRDVPIHLPPEFKEEALALRNRLLHFRLCEFFKVKVDPSALVPGVSPRLNQMALPLLSIIDDADVKDDIKRMLSEQHTAELMERRESILGALLASVVTVVMRGRQGTVSIRDVAAQFNVDHCADFGGPVSNRWVGHMLRTRLDVKTRKSKGIYILCEDEPKRLLAIAMRFGIEATDFGHTN